MLGFGAYPLGLELAVEAIYPLDEATGTVLLFFWGQVSALILVTLSAFLQQPLTAEAELQEVRSTRTS